MKKLFILCLVPTFAFANWNIGYTNVDGDMGDGDSISLGALNAAYTWENIQDSDFSVQTGALIGISDDEIDGIDVELDPSFYLKGMYNVNETFFISVNWANVEATASYQGESISGSDSEAGFGFGFNIGDVTLMFDSIEDTDMFSIQYNF